MARPSTIFGRKSPANKPCSIARELRAALINKLKAEIKERGIFLELLDSPEKLRLAVHLILVAHPNLLRDTVRICCADNAELMDTVPLPETVDWPSSYDTVTWWHLNEPCNPGPLG